MTTHTETAPRVYVGTYHKYASGSIEGAWMDLDGHTRETFREACQGLHKDEHDPEFMFQDFEGFPREFYNEGWLDDRIWDWLELDDHQRELLAVYVENVNQDGDITEAEDAFLGVYDSKLQWAEEYMADTGTLGADDSMLARYFDWQAWIRDCELNGEIVFVSHDGHTYVFQTC